MREDKVSGAAFPTCKLSDRIAMQRKLSRLRSGYRMALGLGSGGCVHERQTKAAPRDLQKISSGTERGRDAAAAQSVPVGLNAFIAGKVMAPNGRSTYSLTTVTARPTGRGGSYKIRATDSKETGSLLGQAAYGQLVDALEESGS